MTDFRIEKVKQSLEITLSSGNRMTGTVFLEPLARNHTGSQDPRELLNEDDSFFPFSVEGRLFLMAKDQVKLATYKSNAPPVTVSPTTVGVRIILSNGETIDGAIEVEPRSDAHRLLDYLNGFEGRFLSMTVDRSTHCLINRRMIAGVQQR